MKIGYPCINLSIGCTSNSTFRLASFSEGRFRETVRHNLECLHAILEYNKAHGFHFFRISSDLIPFASHPVCAVPWVAEFKKDLERIGQFILDHSFRISMHPDPFTLLNSPRNDVAERSVLELKYHASLLDAMGLGTDAKIQIHAGGIYGDKPAAIARLIRSIDMLPTEIRRRLVIENDERLYSLQDCLSISQSTGVPLLFDSFHHSILNQGETLAEGIALASKTWGKSDGVLMMDYSSQAPGARVGKHADQIDLDDFSQFLKAANDFPCDVMLEIKDKEKSALEALKCIQQFAR